MIPIAQITLSELRDFLSTLRDDVVLCPGLGTHHPYRNNIFAVAFSAKPETTVAQLKAQVNLALTRDTRVPNRGGGLRYNFETAVFVASPEQAGIPLTMEMLLNSVEIWAQIGQGPNRHP